MNETVKSIDVKFDRDGKTETCVVISASGYDDGYYWEGAATCVYEGKKYYIQDAGSGSGWIPHYSSCSLQGPCKLVSLMQLIEKEGVIRTDDIEYVTQFVSTAMERFFELGCEHDFEETDDDGSSYDLYVDGEKMQEAERSDKE